MKTVFIDIGSHNGQTILIAAKKFPECSLYIGVEPVPELYQASLQNIPHDLKDKIKIYNYAIDVQSEPEREAIFYQDIGSNKLGSSLLRDKKISQRQEIKIKCVDIRYFFSQFKDYHIILKLDVEGKEYDILRGMMKFKLLTNVKRIFVEWHWYKVKTFSKTMHNTIVSQLNRLGFPLTGESTKDEFYRGL